MTAVVLDSSMAIAWLFAEERTPAVLDVRARVIDDGARVPSLWRLEVANILLLAVRRGRMTSAHRDGNLADLERLDISVDTETDAQAWLGTLRLAERHGLTAYDASYLELAERSGLPLATLDSALLRAAGSMGVPTLGS